MCIFHFGQHSCLFMLHTPLPSYWPTPPLLCRFVYFSFSTFVSLVWLSLLLLPLPLLCRALLSSRSILLWFLLQLTGGCCCRAALKCGRLHGQLVIDGRGSSHACVCVWQSKSANSFRKHLSGALCRWFMIAREREWKWKRQTASNGIESQIERGQNRSSGGVCMRACELSAKCLQPAFVWVSVPLLFSLLLSLELKSAHATQTQTHTNRHKLHLKVIIYALCLVKCQRNKRRWWKRRSSSSSENEGVSRWPKNTKIP